MFVQLIDVVRNANGTRLRRCARPEAWRIIKMRRHRKLEFFDNRQSDTAVTACKSSTEKKADAQNFNLGPKFP